MLYVKLQPLPTNLQLSEDACNTLKILGSMLPGLSSLDEAEKYMVGVLRAQYMSMLPQWHLRRGKDKLGEVESLAFHREEFGPCLLRVLTHRGYRVRVGDGYAKVCDTGRELFYDRRPDPDAATVFDYWEDALKASQVCFRRWPGQDCIVEKL